MGPCLRPGEPGVQVICALRFALCVLLCGLRLAACGLRLARQAGAGTTRRASLFCSCPAGLRRGSSFTSQKRLTRLAVPPMAGRQTTFAGEKSANLLRGVGIVGPSRPEDARGRQEHTPSDRTRTTRRGAGAPCRDRRSGTSPRHRACHPARSRMIHARHPAHSRRTRNPTPRHLDSPAWILRLRAG